MALRGQLTLVVFIPVSMALYIEKGSQCVALIKDMELSMVCVVSGVEGWGRPQGYARPNQVIFIVIVENLILFRYDGAVVQLDMKHCWGGEMQKG